MGQHPLSEQKKTVLRSATVLAQDADVWSRTSVVLPAYQERSRLPIVLTVLRALPFARLVVVDDGSTDGTWRAAVSLLRPGDVILRLADNQGKAMPLFGKRGLRPPATSRGLGKARG